jgi:hypothetical protein
LVRVYAGDTLATVHPMVSPGTYARLPGEATASTRQDAYVARLLGHCQQVGPVLWQWAEEALADRGVRAIRLIQGVLALTRRHPRERVLAAVQTAQAQRHFRYQTIRTLTEAVPPAAVPALATSDPAIRSMEQYTLAHFLP